VDSPVSTIGKKIASEFGVRHEDIDVRAKEDDPESIKKRDETITAKIQKVLGPAKRVLVIVGEYHRPGVAKRLKDAGSWVRGAFVSDKRGSSRERCTRKAWI
jgi:nickel-dependent lactate racemase